MVEPVSLTLGAIAAALVAKATEKTAEAAVDGGAGALSGIVAWLRKRFSGPEDNQGATALPRIEDAPDSPSRLRELAKVVDRRADAEPSFRSELAALVEEARSGGVDMGSIVQTAWGHQNVQNAGVVDSEVTVTYGQPPAR